MKKTGCCPKCQSTEIAADAKVIDRGGDESEWDMHVAVFSKSKSTPFQGKHESSISAWICTSCGFMELYADKPGELKPETNPFLRSVRLREHKKTAPDEY